MPKDDLSNDMLSSIWIDISRAVRTGAPDCDGSGDVDDQGRVISVVTFKSDGTLTHRAHSYGLESEKVTVEEDLDQKRETRRRFRQETDRRGRTTLSEEMRVENGRPVTRRTRSTYDSQGRANSQTEIVE